MKKKPITLAQEIFGSKFGNARILNERPALMRSDDPKEDKLFFKRYRDLRREQTKVIKMCLH